MPFEDDEFDFVFETSLCHVAEKQVPRAVRELNRVVKSGLVFGSVTSDMAPELIDRYDLLRGVRKLGTWWEWSELFFGNGFDLSMNRRDCTDALWTATWPPTRGRASGTRTPTACVIRSLTRWRTTTFDCLSVRWNVECHISTLRRAPRRAAWQDAGAVLAVVLPNAF